MKNNYDTYPWSVVRYSKENTFEFVISGLGQNRGTLDATHTKSVARRHARAQKKLHPEYIFKIEGMVEGMVEVIS